MVTEYIKTASIPSRELFREVEPIAPYPRINPQQPRQEQYPSQQQDAEAGRKKHVRRRFTTMRKLIDRIKEADRVTRVSYGTAEQELRDLGFETTEDHLVDRLLEIKTPLATIEEILRQIQQQKGAIDLQAGAEIFSSQPGPFPVAATGLRELNLNFLEMSLNPGKQQAEILERIRTNGYFISEQDRLRLRFALNSSQVQAAGDALELKISVLVAALEMDEAGRRAIIYQRRNRGYALYADKQINLAI